MPEPVTISQFVVRCVNGELHDEDVYSDVAFADLDVPLWDRDCEAGEGHRVWVRHVTTTAWEPLDDPAESRSVARRLDIQEFAVVRQTGATSGNAEPATERAQ
jgi:hypothetical protein